MNEPGCDIYLVNEPAPPSSTYITWLSDMHKAIYCACMIHEHSTKSKKLLDIFFSSYRDPGADILGVLGV